MLGRSDDLVGNMIDKAVIFHPSSNVAPKLVLVLALHNSMQVFDRPLVRVMEIRKTITYKGFFICVEDQ